MKKGSLAPFLITFCPCRLIQTPSQTIQIEMSRLIRMHIVCHSIIHFNSNSYMQQWMSSRKQGSNESLRKHAYSNTLKILPPKNENFQIKISDIFHISDQNIDCGYSLEPPQHRLSEAVLSSTHSNE